MEITLKGRDAALSSGWRLGNPCHSSFPQVEGRWLLQVHHTATSNYSNSNGDSTSSNNNKKKKKKKRGCRLFVSGKTDADRSRKEEGEEGEAVCRVSLTFDITLIGPVDPSKMQCDAMQYDDMPWPLLLCATYLA